MQVTAKDLISALGIEQKEHIAIVGGGGKTTLMFALADELCLTGRKVITTTTTKVWYREASRSPCMALGLSDSAWHKNIRHGLQRHGYVFIARRVLDSGKVEGIDSTEADEFYQDPLVDDLILEADGSAGRPLKAPDEHEPVIPSSATLVVAMMGLEVIGRRIEPKFVFRSDLFEKVTGIGPGQKLTIDGLVRLFESPEGLFKGAPSSARRIAFLNKFDLTSGRREAIHLADELLRSSKAVVDRVVIGSIIDNIYHIHKERS